MAGDVEMAGPDNGAAPVVAGTSKSKFEELNELLRDAEGRKPTSLELKLVGTLLSSPLTSADREDGHLPEFLSTALRTSIEWRCLELWDLLVARFESLGTSVREPETALKALCVFQFEPIRPCLEHSLKLSEPGKPDETLGFLESLDLIVSKARKSREPNKTPTHAASRDLRLWILEQRERICKALPHPKDELEEICQHCLKHGGLSYVHTHLIPLYTNDRVNRGTLLCELGLYINSSKAFPDNPLKTEAVLKLLRAGMGRLYPLTAENHERQFQTTYAALDAYLGHGGVEHLDVLFTGISQVIQSIDAKDLIGSMLIHSLGPFVTRLTSTLADKHTGAFTLIQTHLDTLVNSIADVIFNSIQMSENTGWPKEWADSAMPSNFRPWLHQLTESEGGILSALLSRLKGCVDGSGRDLSTANWRGCLETLCTSPTYGDRSNQGFIQTIKTLAEHYARHHASLADDRDVALELYFLITVLDDPSPLNIFCQRFVSVESLHYSLSDCPTTAVLDNKLEEMDYCPCQMQLNLVEAEFAIKHMSRLAQGSVDRIRLALSTLTRAWFKKSIFVSPPKMMSKALQALLPGARPCEANCGRIACDTIRDFIRGTAYEHKQILLFADVGPRITEHLLSHWDPAGFDYTVPWNITRFADGVRVEKKHETMWRPGQWQDLLLRGRNLLNRLFTDEETLRQALGDDYEAIVDAVRNPRSAQPPDEPDSEDATNAKEEPADGVIDARVDEDEADSDETLGGDSGEVAGAGKENGVAKGQAATASKAATTRRAPDDVNVAEPPSKKQKTA